MHPLESIKQNKNLLRVAAELGGKRTEGGNNDGIDEVEAIGGINKEPALETEPVVEEDIQEIDVDDLTEHIQQFSDLVIEQIENLEENLNEELVNEDLDFAIDKIIDNMLPE